MILEQMTIYRTGYETHVPVLYKAGNFTEKNRIVVFHICSYVPYEMAQVLVNPEVNGAHSTDCHFPQRLIILHVCLFSYTAILKTGMLMNICNPKNIFILLGEFFT